MSGLKIDSINQICYRYKHEVMGVDGKFKAKFVFWDNNCVKLMGKSVIELKRELIEVLTFLSSKRIIYI